MNYTQRELFLHVLPRLFHILLYVFLKVVTRIKRFHIVAKHSAIIAEAIAVKVSFIHEHATRSQYTVYLHYLCAVTFMGEE